jgi:hypothetical protein
MINYNFCKLCNAMTLNKFDTKDSYGCIRCDVYSSHLINSIRTIEYLNVDGIYLTYDSNDQLITIRIDTNGLENSPIVIFECEELTHQLACYWLKKLQQYKVFFMILTCKICDTLMNDTRCSFSKCRFYYNDIFIEYVGIDSSNIPGYWLNYFKNDKRLIVYIDGEVIHDEILPELTPTVAKYWPEKLKLYAVFS